MRAERGNRLPVANESIGLTARLPTPLCQEEVLGVIWAAAGRVRVPVRCFPMQVALDVLDQSSPPDGRLRRALASWPRSVTSRGLIHVGVDQFLVGQYRSGFLSVEGQGWEVGYRPTESWLERCHVTLLSLNGRERVAVHSSAQRLVACVTTWSKNSLASLPERSLTS